MIISNGMEAIRIGGEQRRFSPVYFSHQPCDQKVFREPSNSTTSMLGMLETPLHVELTATAHK
jgi:hypothetical protein